MSLGTAEPASETGDDSLSAITFDSDSETKAKRKSFHKPPPTSLKSPYHSKPRKVASWRSLRTVASMPLGGRMSLTPQKLCLGSSKQGYVPGTLIYREKEDMYDEIIELKKSLNMQKSDVDLMRTKLRRLEEENSRKDRQIEQLLDASRGPDFVRTLADKRPDTGWVINGLKQRVLKLEQRCKEKDNMIKYGAWGPGALPGGPAGRTRTRPAPSPAPAPAVPPLPHPRPGLACHQSLSSGLFQTPRRSSVLLPSLLAPVSLKTRLLSTSCDLVLSPVLTSWTRDKLLLPGHLPRLPLTSRTALCCFQSSCRFLSCSFIPEGRLSCKLQTDVKTTSLEEMRIAMETYYEEIHRLHGLLASSETTGKRPPVEKKVGLKRQKKMGSALLSLSRSVQELMEENQSLKEDLDRVLSNSPTTSKITGYADWSKPRLVRRIAELEKKLSSMESAKPQASEGARSASLTPSASSPTAHLQESERLRGAVQSLTGERAALHSQLQERDLEVKQLLQTKAELEQELESVKEGERERREREKVLREELQALTRKFRELEGSKKEEEDEAVAVAPETREEPQPPSPTASPSQPDAEPDKSQGGSSRPPSTCPEGRRDAAARVLQRRWRGCQHQKERALLDEAATVLQAAFRGHLARARLLSSRACVSEPPRVPSPPTQDSPKPRVPSPAVQAEGDSWQEEAVTIIQSAFRAHLARASAPCPGPTTATVPERPARPPPRAPSSPPCPAAAPGQGDSEGSSRETAKGPAPENRVPRPPPCSAEPPVSGLQPTAPAPAEDVNSDDSDEIVLAPSLPTRKSASPR